MDWLKILTIIIATFGMFLWGQRESRCEMRAFQSEIRGWKEEINKQMTDFHGRLCSLEERRKQND